MLFPSNWLSRTLGCLLLFSNSVPLFAQEVAEQPVLESPLAVEPTTTDGYIKATLLMVQLARPEMGKKYLAQLLAGNPSDEELLAARETFGTGTFLSLTRVEGLQPEADQLLKLLNGATLHRIKQPGYVEQVIPKLSGNARERAEAFTELSNLGPYAIPAMLKALQNDLRDDQDVLIYNMSRLGPDVVSPMIGALSSPNQKVRSAAAEVIGWNGSVDSTLWLWHPGFSESQPEPVQTVARQALARIIHGETKYASRVDAYGASRKLLTAATDLLAGRYEWPSTYGDAETISLWSWNDALSTVEEHVVSRRAAALHYAERMSREAAELSPANNQAPIVLLTALLARDVENAGWNKPVPRGPGSAFDLAVAAGPESCEEVLRMSLDLDVTSASVAAIQALALNGSENMLRSSESVILTTLDAPSHRLQYAAAITILQWQPEKPFPKAARVIEILTRAINSNRRGDTVIMDPNVLRGSQTSSLFGELGYDSTLTRTGMEGFLLAAKRGDMELVVLHPNVIRWELTQTIANLRADSRTQNLPVVIYGPASIRNQFDRISAEYQQVVFINEAVSATDIIRELGPILANLTPPPLSEEQRTGQIQEAAFWLSRIASSNANVFDLTPAEEVLANALTDPNVARDVVIAYGSIGRPAVQERLMQLVTSPAETGELRELAALQLGFHIQKFGPLLSNTNVEVLKTAYNSEADPLVKSALAAVIGSLKPMPQNAREQILSFPASKAPIGSTTEMGATEP